MGLCVWHVMAVLLGSALLACRAVAVAEEAAQQHHLSVSRAARQPGAAAVSMHTVVPSSCTREADWEVVGLYYSFMRCAAPPRACLARHCCQAVVWPLGTASVVRKLKLW